MHAYITYMIYTDMTHERSRNGENALGSSSAVTAATVPDMARDSITTSDLPRRYTSHHTTQPQQPQQQPQQQAAAPPPPAVTDSWLPPPYFRNHNGSINHSNGSTPSGRLPASPPVLPMSSTAIVDRPLTAFLWDDVPSAAHERNTNGMVALPPLPHSNTTPTPSSSSLPPL
ncbi:hypothetical protein BCR43DRAFT_285059 [Syncephalastrum racemosum]|uniref:Uncharacterized protein n=1 Tax=Syncephalastrum racemosum TaxID=13706 RepID=A0A1X2HD18_SYNRA|nr:hypothetical protein BCR43DRAFT_285059 [Syncephalastrum racemosum]